MPKPVRSTALHHLLQPFGTCRSLGVMTPEPTKCLAATSQSFDHVHRLSHRCWTGS